jgi:hypothetical protein
LSKPHCYVCGEGEGLLHDVQISWPFRRRERRKLCHSCWCLGKTRHIRVIALQAVFITCTTLLLVLPRSAGLEIGVLRWVLQVISLVAITAALWVLFRFNREMQERRSQRK